MNVSVLSMVPGVFAAPAYYISLLTIVEAGEMSIISLVLLILGIITALAALYYAYRTFRYIPPQAPSLWWMARGAVGGLIGLVIILAIIINSIT